MIENRYLILFFEFNFFSHNINQIGNFDPPLQKSNFQVHDTTKSVKQKKKRNNTFNVPNYLYFHQKSHLDR